MVFIYLVVGVYVRVRHQSYHGWVFERVRDVVREHTVAAEVVRELDTLSALMRCSLSWTLPWVEEILTALCSTHEQC